MDRHVAADHERDQASNSGIPAPTDWRPDLVLQTPRERHQPALAELPVSLRQPQDIMPPSASPLLGNDFFLSRAP